MNYLSITSSVTVILLILMTRLCNAQQQNTDFIVIGNSLPPFSIESNGKLIGLSIDLLDILLTEEYGDECWVDTQPLPFARAFSKVTNHRNTIAVNFARNQKRESKFQWVGPYYNINMAIIGLAGSRNKYQRLSDLHGERIGVVRGTMVIDIMRQAKFPEDNLVVVADPITALKMLRAGRIGMVAHIPKVLSYLNIVELGGTPDQLVKALDLAEGEFYFAFSKDFPSSHIKNMQANLEMLQSRGHVSELFKNYEL